MTDLFAVWNLKLLQAFFSRASAGDDVFLNTDSPTLDEIGQDLGGDAGFIDAIRKGPGWCMPDEPFVNRCLLTKALRKSRLEDTARPYIDPGAMDPTYRGLHAPAYLPFLAATVRSSAHAGRDYYTHLTESVGSRSRLSSPDLARIDVLWEDLEQWSRSLDGNLGRFKHRQLGGHRYIGIPRSQCILKQKDARNLPIAFWRAGLRPSADLGGRLVDRIVREVILDNGHFTRPFKEACEDKDLLPPITDIVQAVFYEWDGTLPEAKTSTAGGLGGEPTTKDAATLQLCLAIEVAEEPAARLCWRVPPMAAGHAIELAGSFGGRWRGTSNDAEWTTVHPLGLVQAEHWADAEAAVEGEAVLRMSVGGGDDSETRAEEVVVNPHKLWILVPDLDFWTGIHELRENPLPGSGPAYILVPPASVDAFNSYVDRESPKCSKQAFAGIPEGWEVVLFRDCESLTESQRTLPDGAAGPHPRPRELRLRGGRSVLRGANRHYVHYDLPQLELEAAVGTTLSVMGNILLEEMHGESNGHASAHVAASNVRKFALECPDATSGSNRILAMRGGQIVDQIRVRVAGNEPGMPSPESTEVGMDPRGEPVESTNALRGAWLGGANDVVGDEAWFEVKEPPSFVARGGSTSPANPQLQLLDTVARLGSVAWGPFRDQAIRLAAKEGQPAEPGLALIALRRRGFIEVATTSRGHMARAHACPPAIYATTRRIHGRRVFGIAGSLTIGNWQQLVDEDVAWQVVGDASDPMTWMLVENSDGWAAEAGQDLGFRVEEEAAARVTQWCASLAEVRASLLSDATSDIGRASEGARRFNPEKGKFTAQPSQLPCELWRVTDLSTGMDNVHVLAHQERFSFVRDSSWGKWISLEATARHFSDVYAVPGIYPLPIPYEATSGTVWLPARLNLPVVMERALVLCAGMEPEVHELRKGGVDRKEDSIVLEDCAAGRARARVHSMYEKMAEGRWLAYRAVPLHVAETLARKLEAQVDAR